MMTRQIVPTIYFQPDQLEISFRRSSTVFRSTVIRLISDRASSTSAFRFVFAFAEQFALELIGERYCFKDK